MEENLWQSTKTKVSLRPKLKKKILWNTCDKELDGKMKSACENYFKSSLEILQNPLPFREIYVTYLEKIYIGIVNSYIT